MARKLEVGDKVKLSKKGLDLRGPSRAQYEGKWQQAVKRDPKDTYIISEVTTIGSETWVQLNLPRKWFWQKKGPLDRCWVRKEWVKRAE